MKYQLFFILLLTSYALGAASDKNTDEEPPTLATYRAAWLVVGAGPAGISAVAALHDANVRPENIIWVDEAFKVGDLGKHYHNVPANSSRKTFLHYFNLSPHLKQYINYTRHLQTTSKIDCTLQEVVDPLSLISNRFRQNIASIRGSVQKLAYNHQSKLWITRLPSITLEASNVILATGSHPKQLEHPGSTAQRIALETALDIKTLKTVLTCPNDRIAVFGSSHSAALILKNLVELNCTKIIHIYKQDFRFRQKTRLGKRYPFSGLKGPVAIWAKEHLIRNPHPAITHLQYNSTAVDDMLKTCTTIIDAVGFEPNTLPVAPEDLYPTRKTPHELGPHLYGIGIAFPSVIQDKQGNKEVAVGLLSFMQTLKEHLPRWLNAA